MKKVLILIILLGSFISTSFASTFESVPVCPSSESIRNAILTTYNVEVDELYDAYYTKKNSFDNNWTIVWSTQIYGLSLQIVNSALRFAGIGKPQLENNGSYYFCNYPLYQSTNSKKPIGHNTFLDAFYNHSPFSD